MMVEKNIYEFSENVFKIVGKDSALLTAGDIESFNSMTISWGTLGVLWGKNVFICYVRPTRYTYSFMEKVNTFTISFFSEKYKRELVYLGSHSGRDEDKIKKCNLTANNLEENCVGFHEARLTFVCKKIYHQDLDESKIDDTIKQRNYPQGNFHRMYIGEIIHVYETN